MDIRSSSYATEFSELSVIDALLKCNKTSKLLEYDSLINKIIIKLIKVYSVPKETIQSGYWSGYSLYEVNKMFNNL